MFLVQPTTFYLALLLLQTHSGAQWVSVSVTTPTLILKMLSILGEYFDEANAEEEEADKKKMKKGNAKAADEEEEDEDKAKI